ncbi:hypothetical protein ACFQJ7_17290 [Halovenus rubra]|uniref:Uncharacterized protein n=2 Tax=Halovenus rubra TaxID=869890 RepID=A0ABD5XEX6_9EURY|nr:hypothetical protein [Halovenus rubra]
MDDVNHSVRSTDRSSEVLPAFTAVVMITLPADVVALSLAGVLPESVSLLGANPIGLVPVSVLGLLFGALGAYTHQNTPEQHFSKRIAVVAFASAVPAIAANLYFPTSAYLFSYFVFNGPGYGFLYLYYNHVE